MKLLAAFTTSIIILAACGSSATNNGIADTTPPTASTNTVAPQSTTTLAAFPQPPATVTIATVAETTAQPAPATTPPTTKGTTPPTAVPPTTGATKAPTTTATIAPTTIVTADGQYTVVSPPNAPSVSARVMADNSHPDGVYYATVTEGGDPPPPTGSVVFELVQLFRGADCTSHFGAADHDSCVNDYGVETNPTSTLSVPLGSQYISVADAATQKSMKISGAELYGLIHGDNPTTGAPPGYTYVGFGFFLTIKGGVVTRLEQWWTP